MASFTNAKRPGRIDAASKYLELAAAPAFVCMAWVTKGDMVLIGGSNAGISPINGMTVMSGLWVLTLAFFYVSQIGG